MNKKVTGLTVGCLFAMPYFASAKSTVLFEVGRG